MSDLVVALDAGMTNIRVEVRERDGCRLRVCEGARGWLAGDEQAARIAEHAAAHLAAAAIAVLRRLDAQHRRFAMVGGLSTHAAFAAAATSRVAAGVPETVCVPARGDALDGAALLAVQPG